MIGECFGRTARSGDNLLGKEGLFFMEPRYKKFPVLPNEI